MKKPAKIAIFNSIISIVLCLALMAGATLALFTSKPDANIAVTSGSVRVVATPSLTEASSAQWDDASGSYIRQPLTTDGNRAEFVPGGTASIDGDGDVILDRIMPGDSATIRIDIQNTGTIDATIQLKAAFENDYALLDILSVSLKASNRDLNIVTNNYAEKQSKWLPLSVGGKETLDLTIAYPDEYINVAPNTAKQANISLVVLAYQANAHTEDPTEVEPSIVAPEKPIVIGASELNQYKILQAQEVEGYDFLYWAYKPSLAAGIASRTAYDPSFGAYLTNSPVYKFRVTEQTLGTYTAVYQARSNLTSIIRLSKTSPVFTVQDNYVGTTVTLIAESELWYTFTFFTREQNGSYEELQSAEPSMYTFTPKSGDVGAVYTAKYAEFSLENYEDYFDNTGAISYEATIIRRDVGRPTEVEVGAGGIDGGADDKGYGDYPIYARGYKNYSKDLNMAVLAENNELAMIGSKYFMDSEGTLYEFAPPIGDELDTLYDELADRWCKEKGYPEGSCRSDNPAYDLDIALQFIEEVMKDAYNGAAIWKPVGHLYKHLEAENLYLGEVDPEQPAVEKVISATPRGSRRNFSPTITGLYAPAGEVITFKMSAEEMERTGGMIVTIGQVQLNGNGKALGENRTRRPHFLTTQFTLTAKIEHPDWANTRDADGNYVFYFGSYIGGPIYVSPVNAGEHFTVDISGAVEYQHFIYGATTEDEFNSRADCIEDVPYFDLYVTTEDVRFSGPSYYAKGLDFENFVKVSRIWEQTARISKRFPNESYNEYGVTFDYDLYMAGGAIAWPNANTVNSELSWMGGALNYNSIIKYGGWGNFHEFNHIYQLFGWRDPEVANNAVNLVEFATLTEVSATRQRNADGTLAGVSGWYSYTDPAYPILVNADPDNKTGLLNSSRDKNLCRYVNIFYAFGIDRFIDGMQRTSAMGYTHYNIARGASEGCGYDMGYYFRNLLGFSINSPTTYPTFVPVASPYQTGVGHAYDPETKIGVDATARTENVQWEYSHSSSPYRIDLSHDFTLDFETTLALPGREWDEASGKMTDTQFEWTIDITSQPTYGTVTRIGADGRNFIYTPNEDAIHAGTSGSMIFTVTYRGIEGSAAQGIRGSVQIVVQFDQMPGTAPDYEHLDRTVYTYNSADVDNSDEEEEIEEAAGAAAIAEGTDAEEPAPQDPPKSSEELFADANTAWLDDIKTAGGKFDGTFADAMYMTTEENTLPENVGTQNNTAVYFDDGLNAAPANSFIVISGIYTPKADGEYYLGLESVGNSALYISEDGTAYHLLVSCGPDAANTGNYIDGVVNGAYRAAAKIALHAGQPIYFREVLSPDLVDPNGDHVKMVWGQSTVSATSELTDRLSGSADHTGCAYCLRETGTKEYESEYWEERHETYFEAADVKQSLVGDEQTLLLNGKLEKLETLGISGYNKEPVELGNLFNENPYDFYAVSGISSSTPLKLTVQLDKEITADTFIIHAYCEYSPNNFKLYVGNSENDINTLVYERNRNNFATWSLENKTGTIKASFKDGPKTFKYYRLEVYQTVRARKIENVSKYVLMLNGIEFGNQWNVKQPSDRDVEKLGGWDNVRTVGSTFGYLLTAKGTTDKEPFSSLTMKFTGKELHIRACVGPEYGAVEILIDGKSIADIDLRATERKWADLLSESFLTEDALRRLSDALSQDGEHTLVLRSIERFNIDAVYYR